MNWVEAGSYLVLRYHIFLSLDNPFIPILSVECLKLHHAKKWGVTHGFL